MSRPSSKIQMMIKMMMMRRRMRRTTLARISGGPDGWPCQTAAGGGRQCHVDGSAALACWNKRLTDETPDKGGRPASEKPAECLMRSKSCRLVESSGIWWNLVADWADV